MRSTSELHLEWKNLNFSVPVHEENNYKVWQFGRKSKEINILNNVSGGMKDGDLVAILGGSGAGKTTLLAAISQRLRGNITGDVVLNGVAIDREEMCQLSSFLPQFGITVRTFTAYEHLYYMSHFKMHRKTTQSQKIDKVNKLLHSVGLGDSAHTRIIHLSGGERKRLSLAEELIIDPPFLFCDEPTTGLDSFSAYSVVETLRKLCKTRFKDNTDPSETVLKCSKSNASIEMEAICAQTEGDDLNYRFGKGVMCSIHQPTSDIFELFTHLILMDNGRVIFQGTIERAHQFFERLGFQVPKNCNPADYFLKTIADSHNTNGNGRMVKLKFESEISGLYSDSWLDRRSYSPGHISRINKFEKISWVFQVYLLMLRYVIENSRNLKENITSLGIFMITAVTLALMYSGVSELNQLSVQDITGSIFVLTTEFIFTASYSQMFVFPPSLPILRREVGEKTYSLSAYYVSVALSNIPVAFFKTYLYLAVVYAGLSYGKGWMAYLKMGFVLSLSAISGSAYGTLISSIFEKEMLASELASPFDLFFLIFSGAYYNVDGLPFIKYFSIFYYANEAIMYDYWIDITNIECSANSNHPCIKNGVEVLESKNFRTANGTLTMDCILLVVCTLVFHILAYTLIKKYVRRTGYY